MMPTVMEGKNNIDESIHPEVWEVFLEGQLKGRRRILARGVFFSALGYGL